MDKYAMIEDMKKKIDLLADAKGALRCGLLWDVACMLNNLGQALKAEDEANAQKIEALKAQNAAMEEGKKK